MALQMYAEGSHDDQELAKVHRCITALQSILAGHASDREAALGTTPAMRHIRRTSGSRNYETTPAGSFPRYVPGTFSVIDGRRVFERGRWVKPEGETEVVDVDVPAPARTNEATASSQAGASAPTDQGQDLDPVVRMALVASEDVGYGRQLVDVAATRGGIYTDALDSLYELEAEQRLLAIFGTKSDSRMGGEAPMRLGKGRKEEVMTKILGAVAALVAALIFVGPAGADQPVTGTFPVDLHATFPAGTFCSFPVRVDLDGIGRFSVYSNPPMNIQHYEQQGTITANGITLLVDNHWNVTTTPPSSPDQELGVFTQRGARFHILLPGGGIVLLDAGYLVTLFPSGTVVVSHGQFPFEVQGDVSAVCTALTP